MNEIVIDPWKLASSARRRHVVFVIAGLGAGGAEKVISLISRAWVAKGWRVTILAFDEPDAPIYHQFDARVEFRRFGLPTAGGGASSMLAIARRIGALRRTLRTMQPDAIISMLTKINVLTLVATLGTGLPVIVSERNNPLVQQASSLWNGLLAHLYPSAAAIVLQTRASRQCVPMSARSRIRVIPNPVATPSGGTMGDSPSLVLAAAGRLTPQKGFDMLIDAFALIADRHPDWTLKIWGEGEMRPRLEAQIQTLGLKGRIALPGTSSTPGGWMADATVMVLSSRYEGFPNVLGEAMAVGLPVIAFDCDFGPQEIVKDGYDGVLVPAGNIQGLADAMERLMNDGPLRRRMGFMASMSATRFAPYKIIAEWEGLVDMVASIADDGLGGKAR